MQQILNYEKCQNFQLSIVTDSSARSTRAGWLSVVVDGELDGELDVKMDEVVDVEMDEVVDVVVDK